MCETAYIPVDETECEKINSYDILRHIPTG